MDATRPAEPGSAFEEGQAFPLALVVTCVMERWALSLPLDLPLVSRLSGGFLLLLYGLRLMIRSQLLIARARRHPQATQDFPHLVTTDVYRVSRNPECLGIVLCQLAYGLFLGAGWLVLLVPPVLVLFYVLRIRHEEAFLDRTCGPAYLDYKRAVRRWI